MYQKEIIYVELSKNGDREGNAGYVKVENKDGVGKLSLRIVNIPAVVSGTFPIRFYNGEEWEEIDGLFLKDGKGVWQTENKKMKTGIQLQILLSDGYQIYGRSKDADRTVPVGTNEARKEGEGSAREASSQQEKAGAQEVPSPQGRTGVQEVSSPQGKAGVQEVSSQQDRTGVQEAPSPQGMLSMREPSKLQEVQAMQGNRAAPEDKMIAEELQNLTPQPDGLKEDKWEQILSSYDNIRPYGDERIYVKLQPKDFVILQAKYQHLVNNSFLLHGFYNYRYVILGKEGDYYLGVPGVFYEREKMVALMFGFEAFECESKTAKTGDFGYYLRKVEL